VSLKESLSIKLRVALWAVVAVGSAVLLSLHGEAVGISRTIGTYVWAAFMIVLIGLLLGPVMARHIGARKTMIFFLVLLAAAIGIYAYVVIMTEFVLKH
jgi:glucan phosphoethanolaminetransferase (alkaline phosphatase superfamily)